MNIDRPGRSIRMPWQDRQNKLPNDDETQVSRRVPLLNFLPLSIKNHFVAMMGEFAGTFLFLLFAFGGTNAVNTAPLDGRSTNLAANPAKLLFISLSFGFSLAVNAWVFFRISGGLFNPAVSLGMMVVGAVPYLRGCLVIVSQILGGIAAAALTSCMLPGPLNIRTELGGGTSVVQGLFIEMFLTAQLVFTIFMLAAEKHRATFIAPVGIGLSLFIAELFGVYYTGGSLNPARSFGPCVVVHEFAHYHWIYWIGPMLGSLLASGFYMFIKALEYETVNPDQDAIGERTGTTFNPETGEEKLIVPRVTDPLAGPGSIDPLGGNTRPRPANTQPIGRYHQSNAENLNSPVESGASDLSDKKVVNQYGHGPNLENGRGTIHDQTTHP